MNGPMDDALPYIRRRGAAGVLVLVLVLCGLGLRLWQLQVRDGAYYYAQAQSEALAPVPIPAPRGQILDRTGLVLARDTPSFAAVLSYTPTPPSDAEVELLSRILDLDPQAIRQAAAALRRGSSYAPVVLRSGLTPAQYTAIVENATRLPGVDVQPRPVRSYPGIPGDADPGPQLAANVLGYVSAGAVPGDVQGAYGIEKSFDTLPPALHASGLGLAGVDGKELVEHDPSFHPVRVYGVQPPVPGNDLVLTMDAGLQAVAQRALEAQLAALRTRTFGQDGGPFPEAWWGAAVAIDVHTGAVLALASVPTFDPNVFAQGAIALPGSATAQAFTRQYLAWAGDTRGRPFTDHAIYDAVAPGSTFKPIVAIAALQAGVLTPWEHLPCPASVRVGNAVLNNWVHQWGGDLDLTEALARSCDTYFYQVGNLVGIDAIDRVASEFGLGQPTGQIALQSEHPGTLASPAVARRLGQPWTPAQTMLAAIGQGFNAFNALEMADYVAALANGGTLWTPYFVSEVRTPDGRVIWRQQPQVRRRIALSPEVLQAVHQALAAVTEAHPEWLQDGADSMYGTAFWPFYGFTDLTRQYLGRAIAVAGKTGTAETQPGVVPDGWFVSYAPADDPQIAIVVHTAHSGEGFVGGAPVAREMYDYWFGLDRAMWQAGKADAIIPPEIQSYFGLGPDEHYPDWWGPPPPAAASPTSPPGTVATPSDSGAAPAPAGTQAGPGGTATPRAVGTAVAVP